MKTNWIMQVTNIVMFGSSNLIEKKWCYILFSFRISLMNVNDCKWIKLMNHHWDNGFYLLFKRGKDMTEIKIPIWQTPDEIWSLFSSFCGIIWNSAECNVVNRAESTALLANIKWMIKWTISNEWGICRSLRMTAVWILLSSGHTYSVWAW